MNKKLESIVKDVCQLSSWKRPYNVSLGATKEEKEEIRLASIAERQGAVGVACMLAFLQGCDADPERLSEAIGVPLEEVKEPWYRLFTQGVFTERYGARKDPVLLGKCNDRNPRLSNEDRTRNAWCQIAGIASGYCGLQD